MTRSTWLLLVGAVFGLSAAHAAADAGRVAVVIARQGGSASLRIAYPAGETADQARADLAAAAIAGHWHTSGDQVSSDATGVVAACRVDSVAGNGELTIWPLVYVLRRFSDLVIAYLGPASPGHGQVDNEYVSVRWQAGPQGTNYYVRIKRHDFTDPLAPEKPTTRDLGQPPASLTALVIVLALLASLATYWVAKRFMSSGKGTAPTSEEEKEQ